MRIAAIVITFVGVARPAIADEAHCGRFASLPPRRPLSGQLRWDIGAGAEALVTGSRFDAELDVGVTKILDYAYQSLDLGVHATVGGAMTSPRAYLRRSRSRFATTPSSYVRRSASTSAATARSPAVGRSTATAQATSASGLAMAISAVTSQLMTAG